ncbi:MAG: hypothetical protein AABX05_03810 [Nanoarchaeota archaeon]
METYYHKERSGDFCQTEYHQDMLLPFRKRNVLVIQVSVKKNGNVVNYIEVPGYQLSREENASMVEPFETAEERKELSDLIDAKRSLNAEDSLEGPIKFWSSW